jgi:hypothetical protein
MATVIFIATALPEFGYIGMAITVLAVAWMSNLYNFMDGSNGLAGGMALFGFGFYGVATAWAGDSLFALLCFGVTGAALGFLFFNFPRVRIFMAHANVMPAGVRRVAKGCGLAHRSRYYQRLVQAGWGIRIGADGVRASDGLASRRWHNARRRCEHGCGVYHMVAVYLLLVLLSEWVLPLRPLHLNVSH